MVISHIQRRGDYNEWFIGCYFLVVISHFSGEALLPLELHAALAIVWLSCTSDWTGGGGGWADCAIVGQSVYSVSRVRKTQTMNDLLTNLIYTRFQQVSKNIRLEGDGPKRGI